MKAYVFRIKGGFLVSSEDISCMTANKLLQIAVFCPTKRSLHKAIEACLTNTGFSNSGLPVTEEKTIVNNRKLNHASV